MAGESGSTRPQRRDGAGHKEGKQVQGPVRETRLADALRANLRRRKRQQQLRAGRAGRESDAPDR